MAESGSNRRLVAAIAPGLTASALVVGLMAQLAAGSAHRNTAVILFVINLALWAFLVRFAVSGRLSLRAVAIAMGCALFASVIFSPSSSKDINSYAFYGMAIIDHGANPYVTSPAELPAEAWSERVSYYWRDSPSVYGPVFSAISAMVMAVAGDSFLLARLGFQLLDAIAVLAMVLIASRRLRNPAIAMALVGINPLLLAFGVNDAHADVLIGLLVMVGCVLLADRRRLLAVAVLAIAALIKITAGMAIVGALVWILRREGLRSVIKPGMLAAAVFGAGMLVGGGAAVLDPLSDASERISRFSVWSQPAALISNDGAVATVATISVVLVAASLMIRTGGRTAPYVTVASGLVAYQLLAAYTLSWYSLWALPVLLLVWRDPLALICMAHGCWLAVAYFNGWVALGVAIVAGGALWASRGRNFGASRTETSNSFSVDAKDVDILS